MFRIVFIFVLFFTIFSSESQAKVSRHLRGADHKKHERKRKLILECYFTSAEFDTFYTDALPKSITSTGISGERNSYTTAPLRNLTSNQLLGHLTLRQFGSLRDEYYIQDRVVTVHFDDENYLGGSSLVVNTIYMAPGTEYKDALPLGKYSFFTISGTGAYALEAGVGLIYNVDIRADKKRIVTIEKYVDDEDN